jgi:hypothetical protein
MARFLVGTREGRLCFCCFFSMTGYDNVKGLFFLSFFLLFFPLS